MIHFISGSDVLSARRKFPDAAILRPRPEGTLVFDSTEDARGHPTTQTTKADQ